MTSIRRAVLLLLALNVVVGVAQGQTCAAASTPRDAAGPFYLPNSQLTDRVGPESLLSDPANRLVVTGRVLGSRNCSLSLSNVTIEVWYAGEPDSAGNYYQDEEYRGQFMTDECGFYNYTQTFPALYPSRPILHNHYRLSRGKQQFLITQMYFVGNGAGYVNNPTSRVLQKVEVTTNLIGEREVQFDFFVDADGDNDCGGPIATKQIDEHLATSEAKAAASFAERVSLNVLALVASFALMSSVFYA